MDVPLQILDYNFSAWHVLQSEFRRLRRYKLVVDIDLPVRLPRTRICAPALECLSVVCLQDPHGTINPLFLFEPEMPGLQRLLLLNVPFWTEHQFTGLTHLALCKCGDSYIYEGQFLDLLRSCPLLQSLVLQRWLPIGCWNRSEELHDDREVRLDHLSQLNMAQDSMDNVMCLVHHLTFPPTTSVIMTATQRMFFAINPLTITSPSGSPGFGDKSTLLLIREPPSTSHDYSERTRPTLISAYNGGDATKFMFFCCDHILEQNRLSTRIPPSIASIFLVLNPAHVENLFLDTSSHGYLPNMALMFQMMPSVKIFSFQCYDYKECLESLWQVEATQSLETVRIVYERCTPYQWAQWNHRFILDLESMAFHRAENGLRLKAIYFDVVQAPDFDEDDTLWEDHTEFLGSCVGIHRQIDTLETQYHSSKWSGDAGFHAQHEYTSWVRDWDLGTL